jgi:hypothetical protein
VATLKWLSYRPKVIGQITPSHGIGKWLEILTSYSKIKNIVEIGAWRGGGSTAIIAQNIRRRVSEGAQAYCLEANRERASEAARRHEGQSNIKVIWGTIVDPDDLDSKNLNESEKEWFKEDLEWTGKAPNVLKELPSEIDLLLLDGGEFSSYAEF